MIGGRNGKLIIGGSFHAILSDIGESLIVIAG